MHDDPDRGFPPFTLVTASSEAVLAGCDDPGEPLFTGGVFSQHVPVGLSEIQRLSFLLAGKDPGTAEIPARIFRCDSPDDPGRGPASERPVAETSFFWTGTGEGWIDWEVNLSPLSGIKVGRYIRVELDLPESVGWVRNRTGEAAFPGAFGREGETVAMFPEETTFCFRVFPAQPCFWASNVLPESSGSHRFTGLWRSDPAAELPQWLEASWRDTLQVEELELVFSSTDECPTAYRIETSAQTGETRTLVVEENSFPRAVHRFDAPVPMDRVRIEFLSTRGAPSVSVRRMQLRRL